MKRTHHCNELRPAHVGQTVTLSGWVHSRRDLGGLIFIDIRDREGRTQTVFDPSSLAKDLFERAAALRSECVISVRGKIRQRPEGTNNAKIPTGEVEMLVAELEVLNMAEVLPFPVDDPEIAGKVNEELRLKYRYLDLRRPEMARNLRLRSKVATATRVFLDEQGFLEVETPTLLNRRRKAPVNSWCRIAVIRGRFMRCRNRRSNSSRSSWWPAWKSIFNSPAVIATKICARTGSRSSHRSTSRCRSSTARIFTT
jgi:aspartyl/asparaginyl-tRNA synthetase